MKTKKFQTWLHQHYRDIRSWIIAIMLLILILLMLNGLTTLKAQVQQTKDNVDALKGLTLSVESLSKENRDQSVRNGQHINCIADLFAKFTRDGQPINIQSLDECKAINDGAIRTPPSGTPPSQAPSPQPQSSPQPSPSQAPSPSPPPPPPPDPGIIPDGIPILGPLL